MCSNKCQKTRENDIRPPHCYLSNSSNCLEQMLLTYTFMQVCFDNCANVMKNKFKCTQNSFILIKVHLFLFTQKKKKKSEYDSRQLVQKLGE